jgi:hypothetical protein
MADGTYVYCLVRSERRPRLARAPRGVPRAAALRLLDGPAGAWIVCAHVPLDQYGADAINSHLKDLEWVSERALAHEGVVEFFARAHDVIPLKLFTIFRDDERARTQVGGARALSAVFRRIAGCAEWSVRLSCTPAVAAEGSARGSNGRRRSQSESGTAFLRRKKTQRDEVHKGALAARVAVEQVFRRLGAIARDAVRKQSDVPGSRLVLDAAFLVPRTKERAFEREVARLSASAANGSCELVLSGPWPPYHFVASKGSE